MKFRTKTIVGVALIEAVVLTVLTWAGIGSLQSSNEAEIERRLAIGSRLIVASVRDAVIAQDIGKLDGIAGEIVGTGDLAYLRVLDERGRMLAQHGRLPPVGRHQDHDLWAIEDDVYDRDAAVTEGGQSFGVVQFGIDVGPVRALVARTRHLAAWISVSGMVLVALFSFGLGTYLTRQLLRLRDASLAVAGGDLSHGVRETGDDELAQTVAAFNVMVGELRAAQDRRQEEERRKAADAARLQQQYDELQRLNRQLVEQQQALSKARDAAEAASVAKSRFLAMMSHELRTPLNGMLGMGQLLKDPALSQAQRVDYLDTQLESGRVLLALLEDILDLSRAEAGRFDLAPAPVDPSRLLGDGARLHAGVAAQKGLRMSVRWEGPCPRLILDPVRVRQMLGHLVSNAVKFTDAGSVLLEGRQVSATRDQVVVEFVVTDTGVGIPEALRDRLFQPFTQVDDSTTRRFGGSGLGLSIVRQLAQRMGGEVGFESPAGGGARFRLRLPAEPAPAATPADAPDADAPAGGRSPADAPARKLSGHVLVAEDNPVNRKLAAAMLARAGLAPVFANDGLQAAAVFECGEPVDLVLMDLDMPVLDGYGAARRIRALEAARGSPRVPIVALTASALDEHAQQCAQAGMDGFLTKPLVYERLLQALSEWLPARAAEDRPGHAEGGAQGCGILPG